MDFLKYFSEAAVKKVSYNHDWQTTVTCLAYGNTWEFCKMTMNLEKVLSWEFTHDVTKVEDHEYLQGYE